jgi:replicative DNA helicase
MAVSAPPMQRQSRDPDVERAKVPPHSLEAERSLLGSMLLDNTSTDDIITMVISDDFYLPQHRVIFTAIAELI